MSSTATVSDEELSEKAREIRRLILRAVHAAASGHPGGPLGLADIFSVLFFDILRYKPSEPDWAGRDRLLISNGHVCAVRYASMALAGYFPVEDLDTFRKLGSPLQGHPSTKWLAGVDNSSGSLGQGLSAAIGLSLGARMQGQDYRVYCCISDGECGEGMTWEAATTAVHYKAPVIAFMDLNGIQIDGFTRDVCDLGNLARKWEAFGWKVREEDGHDIGAIRKAFREAQDYIGGPQIILFKTVLGKGVSFMEDKPGWHGKPPNDEQYAEALGELGGVS